MASNSALNLIRLLGLGPASTPFNSRNNTGINPFTSLLQNELGLEDLLQLSNTVPVQQENNVRTTGTDFWTMALSLLTDASDDTSQKPAAKPTPNTNTSSNPVMDDNQPTPAVTPTKPVENSTAANTTTPTRTVPKNFRYKDEKFGTADGYVYVEFNEDGSGKLKTKDGERALTRIEGNANAWVDKDHSVRFDISNFEDPENSFKVGIPQPKDFSYADGTYGTAKDGQVHLKFNQDGKTGTLETKDGIRQLRKKEGTEHVWTDEQNSVEFIIFNPADPANNFKVQVPTTTTNPTQPPKKPKDFSYTEADGTKVELKFKDDKTAELIRNDETRTLRLKDGTTNIWADPYVQFTISNFDDPVNNFKVEVPPQQGVSNPGASKITPDKKLHLSDESFKKIKGILNDLKKYGDDPNQNSAAYEHHYSALIQELSKGTGLGFADIWNPDKLLPALGLNRKFDNTNYKFLNGAGPRDVINVLQHYMNQMETSDTNKPLDSTNLKGPHQ